MITPLINFPHTETFYALAEEVEGQSESVSNIIQYRGTCYEVLFKYDNIGALREDFEEHYSKKRKLCMCIVTITRNTCKEIIPDDAWNFKEAERRMLKHKAEQKAQVAKNATIT